MSVEGLDMEDDALIRLAKEYIALVAKLKEEAQTDYKKQPTPSILAAKLGVTVEEVIQIGEFAENDLGDYEAEMIREKASGFLDSDGKEIIEGYPI